MHRNRGARSADPRRDLVSEHHASAGAHHWPARNSWKNRADGTSVSPSEGLSYPVRAMRNAATLWQVDARLSPPLAKTLPDAEVEAQRRARTLRVTPSAQCGGNLRGAGRDGPPTPRDLGTRCPAGISRGDRLGRVDGRRQAAAARLPPAPRPNAQRSFRRHSPDPHAGTRSTPGPSPRNALHAPQFGPSRGHLAARLCEPVLGTETSPLSAPRWSRDGSGPVARPGSFRSQCRSRRWTARGAGGGSRS